MCGAAELPPHLNILKVFSFFSIKRCEAARRQKRAGDKYLVKNTVQTVVYFFKPWYNTCENKKINCRRYHHG